VSRVQQIGIPLLLLLPILSIVGVFGNTLRTTTVTSTPVELTVEYPARTRYKTQQTIDIAVRNTADQPLERVTVRLDRAYIDAFEEITFTPDATAITEQAYEVDLANLPAGAVRQVTVELRPRSYWAHHGTVSAAPPDAAPADVTLQTFVFP
jgi:hypothetical protein